MAKRAKVRLPDEVVREILSWLPIKYLSPLKFVSKDWLQLLTKDVHFAKLHFDHSLKINNPFIIAWSYHLEINNFYLATEYTDCDKGKIVKLPISQCGFTIYGICNGLICLSSNTDDTAQVYIWNPCIGEYATIPVPRPKYHSSFPKIKTTDLGFGFHQATNQYKVLRFFGEVGVSNDYCFNVHSHITLYTLGVDSSWRTLVEDSGYEISFRHSPHVNGVLHWFAKRRTATSVLNLILEFDVKDEVFREMLPPPPVDTETDFLMNLGGMLSIFSGRFPEEIQVWVMKEYGVVNSWTKQFKILPTASFTSDHFFSVPLATYQNGEIIIWIHHGKMVVYNPETTSYRKLEELGFQMLAVDAFIGSIISPRDIFGARH